MSKKADRWIAGLFAAVLATVFLLNLLWPDKSFSERENRYLQTFPAFSLSSLLNGEYTPRIENYCADQFIARDRWIALKARLELLQGKKENNGVFLCRGERLVQPFFAPDTRQMEEHIGYVDQLVDHVSVPVTLALIPTSAAIYGELLPAGVQNDSQRAAIEHAYSRTKASGADILSALEQHNEEYLYYRTDHHWTTLGAHRGYLALADAMGFAATEGYSERIVSREFLGTAYSSSGFFWVRPDSISIGTEAPPDVTVERYDTDTPRPGSIYVEDMLATKDKYRFFLGGNTPRIVIRTGQTDRPSLLILRDSFADSLAPFLLRDFSSIHLLDLRYYRESVSEYVQQQNIDEILILYSTEDFFNDNNLALLTR